jgi:hypothetical protein
MNSTHKIIKAKIAAIVILIYAIILFMGTLQGALLDGGFSFATLPVGVLLFIVPAIGIYRRVNWCRIYLGVWFSFALGICLIRPLNGDFQFALSYFVALVLSALSVFLSFFYSPLKDYTRKQPQPDSTP